MSQRSPRLEGNWRVEGVSGFVPSAWFPASY
jgi:hypothetical protein